MVLKVIDLEVRRELMRLASIMDEQALTRDLEAVAAIPNEQILKRERERLFVRKAVSRLPQNLRLIVFLKFWEGEALEEIAQTLDQSKEKTRAEYILALSYLEKVLKPYVLEPNFFTKGNDAAV